MATRFWAILGKKLIEVDDPDPVFDRLMAAGAGVRVTNPLGRNPLRYATRNHKKLLVMDDAVWIGGINFSDHNFAWHDMMLRIEHAPIADWLAAQFDADWSGNVATAGEGIAGIDLLSLDGSGNEAGFAPLLEMFAGARRSIEVISAYPTFPFVDAMAEAARAGAKVTIYTPRPNNKPVIRDWSGPHQTGQAAWVADCAAMNSRGERMRKPL